jgi:hypothetical protein
LIDGNMVMQDRKFLTIDYDEVLAGAQRSAEKIVERVGYKIAPLWPIS